MRRKTLLIVLFTAASIIGAFAQNVSISGYINDAQTGESISGAVVTVEGSNAGTYSNEFGYYVLSSIPKMDTITVTVYHISYGTLSRTITDSLQTRYNFRLSPSNALEEVFVYASKSIIQNNETGIIEIPINQVKSMPALGGETDIFKAIQLMPGVQSGSEGRNALYVRGGSPDQNLILLDDVPLYYVSHLGGFVSVFNSDAIQNVKLYKCGFPAEYGGRISSVVDVRMKEGNNKALHGNLTLGLISTKFSLEGPIVKNKSSFILSGRRFMLDLITKPLSKSILDGMSAGYSFYDINAKINHKFSDKNRIYLSIYNGNDNINTSYKVEKGDETNISKTKWGNSLFSFRWNFLPVNKMFMNTTLSYTRYSYGVNNESAGNTSSYTQKMYSGINDLLFKTDMEFTFQVFRLKAGLHSIYHNYTPKISTFSKKTDYDTQNLNFSNPSLTAFETDLYTEAEGALFPFLIVRAGVRYTSYLVEYSNFSSISPRVALNWILSEKQSIKTSYVSMQQNTHLLTTSGAGIPSDIWMPATKNVAPEHSMQIDIAYSRLLKQKTLELTAEFYYKETSNLIAYKEGASFFKESLNWEDKIETGGTGLSYGMEILLQKKQGNTAGWISYTLAKHTQQFQTINNGNPFPFKYDRRHEISVVINKEFGKSVLLSGTWVFGTGLPITLAYGYFYAQTIMQSEKGFYDTYYYPINLYEGKNDFRMRAYHKLDVALSFIKKKKHGERIWMISVYNLYNRKNPYFYYIDEKEINKPKLYQRSFFPFIPSFSYSFKF